MNPLNYASLDASQRLVETGIVLETEAHWHPIYEREEGSFTAIKIVDWVLHPYPLKHNSIPAPSMAEVWRELPDSIQGRSRTINPNVVGYEHHGDWLYFVKDTNPTDALIDLLIWIGKE